MFRHYLSKNDISIKSSYFVDLLLCFTTIAVICITQYLARSHVVGENSTSKLQFILLLLHVISCYVIYFSLERVKLNVIIC